MRTGTDTDKGQGRTYCKVCTQKSDWGSGDSRELDSARTDKGPLSVALDVARTELDPLGVVPEPLDWARMETEPLGVAPDGILGL